MIATTAPEQPPPSKAYTGYVLFMVLVVMIFNNVDRTILSILVRPIKQEFALSDTQMGWLLGPAFSIVYVVLALPLGRYADVGGIRRSIIAYCLLVWSGFTAGTALAQSYVQIFLMRMGVGVGESGATAPSISMLSDYLSPAARARGISVISIGAVSGMGIGMIMGGWIEESYGWRMAFVAAGTPGVAFALLFRLTIREPVRGANERRALANNPPFLESLRFLLQSQTFRYILLANAFTLFAAMGRNLWEPTFLIRSYEVGELRVCWPRAPSLSPQREIERSRQLRRNSRRARPACEDVLVSTGRGSGGPGLERRERIPGAAQSVARIYVAVQHQAGREGSIQHRDREFLLKPAIGCVSVFTFG